MRLYLYRVLYLYKTPSKFFIQPVEHPTEVLIIDRETCQFSKIKDFNPGHLPANATSSLIYGIIGIKHLINCPYLIVITKATQIGLINGEPIFRMDLAEIIPFNDALHNMESSSGHNRIDWNGTYVKMLESFLKTPHFYFSYSYDITNTLQRNATEGKDTSYRGYDKRFQWNNHVMQDFNKSAGLDKYRLPFILGFISINNIQIGNSLDFILMSRRSNRRAGTRFNSRGIDNEGNVSNFVETEQIIAEAGQCKFSFVQIRGSIPLNWTQKATYKYMPAMKINTDYDHSLAMEKHFSELQSYYKDVSVVNLVNSTGDEGNLQNEFSQNFSRVQNALCPTKGILKYHFFDFHKQCSKLRFSRLSILMDELKEEINYNRYCQVFGNELVMDQVGVIRTNCIDSLDRTNVVQSMIAHHVLDTQLNRLQSIPPNRKLEDFSDFLSVFKNTWADNADALSVQYAGTPALKTDFTRTGQRTVNGLINDGVNATTRYIHNNFLDYFRQDSIDLFLGYFEGYPSPLYRPMDLTSYTATFPVAVVMLTFVILYLYLRH